MYRVQGMSPRLVLRIMVSFRSHIIVDNLAAYVVSYIHKVLYSLCSHRVGLHIQLTDKNVTIIFTAI